MTPARLRAAVSSVLAIGVSAAAVLIVGGFVSSFAVGWRGSLVGQPHLDVAITDFAGLVAGLVAVRPQAIAQLGLLVLVGTPIARVITSLIGFALERDRLYVLLTAAVLAILLCGALLIR